MKKANSNHAAVRPEEQLRTATAKALVAEKTAAAAKEKARSAKRRLKVARKAFKQAKKAAKKALKRVRRAQEELKACMDNAAKGKRRTAKLVQPTVRKAPTSSPGSANRKAPRRKPTLSKRKAPSSTPKPVAASPMPQPKSSITRSPDQELRVEPTKSSADPSESQE
jgi:hypothetical protein